MLSWSMERGIDVCYLGLGNMGLCLLSWSGERWLDVCYLDIWLDVCNLDVWKDEM